MKRLALKHSIYALLCIGVYIGRAKLALSIFRQGHQCEWSGAAALLDDSNIDAVMVVIGDGREMVLIGAEKFHAIARQGQVAVKPSAAYRA